MTAGNSHEQLRQGEYLTLGAHKHADPTTNAIPRWHEALEIKLFYTGGTTINIGDEVFLSRPGDVYLINPCVTHSTWDDDPANDYHMLDLDLPRLPSVPGGGDFRVLEALSAGHLQFVPRVTGDRVLKERIEAVVEAYERGPDSIATLGTTCLLLDALLTRQRTITTGEVMAIVTEEMHPAREVGK